jgi:hypothetical protein
VVSNESAMVDVVLASALASVVAYAVLLVAGCSPVVGGQSDGHQ